MKLEIDVTTELGATLSRLCKVCGQQRGKNRVKVTNNSNSGALTSSALSDTGAPPLSDTANCINDPPPPSSFLQVHPKPFLPHTPSSSRYTNTTDHVRVRVFQNNAAHWLYLLTTPYAQSSLNILTLIGGDSRFVPRLVVTKWDAH